MPEKVNLEWDKGVFSTILFFLFCIFNHTVFRSFVFLFVFIKENSMDNTFLLNLSNPK